MQAPPPSEPAPRPSFMGGHAPSSEQRDFVVLATGLWLLLALALIGFNIAIGAPRFLDVFPFLWAAHGLLLTWPLHHVIGLARPTPFILRWAIIAATILGVTAIQTRLDAVVVQAVYPHIAPPGVGAALVYRTGSSDPGTDIGPAFSFMFYFWVFGCYSIASTLLRSHHRLAAALAGERRAELTALRLQMNPHFLFNALNSLSTLIMLGRTEEADRMTMRLSTFLRDALMSDPGGSVTLGDDLAVIENYLDIERVRFADRLMTEIDLPESLQDALLPSFMVQPLVENAVKHAVARSTEPVTIRISAVRTAKGIDVAVANSLPRLETPGAGEAGPTGTGTGLTNIRNRLHAIYGDRASLTTSSDASGYAATLHLPERRNED